jgi:hypothetical protein
LLEEALEVVVQAAAEVLVDLFTQHHKYLKTLIHIQF